jgi:hypothetical protein
LLSHHGAEFAAGKDRMTIDDVLDEVGATHHVVSVGTTNTYGHPHTSTLDALGARAPRARVTCTQVNRTCLAAAALPRAAAATLPQSATLGLGLATAASCPCAGTVRFVLREGTWETSPDVAQHGAVVDSLGDPRCRRTA